MAQFSDRMVPEVVQVFWAAMARGEFITTAAAEVGTYREKGMRWLRAEGTMPCDAPWPEEDVEHFRAWIDDAMPQ
jgi:hypothetical protein